MFKAIMINKNAALYDCNCVQVDNNELPDGNVTVDIDYSSLNYKDALAITNQAPIVRKFPLVPGIDFTGRVTQSNHPNYKAGDDVLLNGWGVGEKYWGGFSQRARVNGDWLIHRPKGITAKQAMSIGTAGYTAMLCIMSLIDQGVKPENGEIIVSGATGGVGTIAIHLLSKLGYDIAAITGKSYKADMLKSIGARTIILRQELSEKSKPLEKERWIGAIDVVGGTVLANICASMKYRGVVTACGLAGGMVFPATVAPFILRAVKLIGIDSVMCPINERIEAWNKLADVLDFSFLEKNTVVIKLSDVKKYAPDLLAGKLTGRIVIDVNQ